VDEKRVLDFEAGYDAALALIEKIDRLGQVQERIALTDGFSRIWDVLQEEITRLIRAEGCGLFGVEEKTHAFVLREVSDPEIADLCRREIELQIESGAFAWVINRRQPSLIPSLAFSEGWTVLLLPLSTPRQILGAVLVITAQDPSGITHETVRLLTMLARQGALVMENRFLYDRLRQDHEKLRHAQNQIIRAEKLASIGRMAAGASHEILNPLTILSGHLQMLQLQEDLGAGARQKLALVQEQCARIARVVKDLMRFSRNGGEHVLSLDLNILILKGLRLAEKDLRSSLIEVSLDLQENIFPVSGDPEALLQVFLNLVKNARQAMPEGGRLHVSSRMGDDPGVASGNRRFVEMRIRDTGYGIPVELQAKLFEPFLVGGNTTERMGLGLYLCYRIVHGHGGRIDIKSSEGEGTRVIVALPAGPPP